MGSTVKFNRDSQRARTKKAAEVATANVNELAGFVQKLANANNSLAHSFDALDREVMFNRFGLEALVLLVEEIDSRPRWKFWQKRQPIGERFAVLRQERADAYSASVTAGRAMAGLHWAFFHVTEAGRAVAAAVEGDLQQTAGAEPVEASEPRDAVG